MAIGFKDTIELVCGPQENLHVMSFYNGNGTFNLKAEIKRIFENVDEKEQLIICTDIQFGSVNQQFLKEALKHKGKNIHLVSGINLPLLLEMVTTPGLISKEMLSNMIEKASNEIIKVNLDSSVDCSDGNDLFDSI